MFQTRGSDCVEHLSCQATSDSSLLTSPKEHLSVIGPLRVHSNDRTHSLLPPSLSFILYPSLPRSFCYSLAFSLPLALSLLQPAPALGLLMKLLETLIWVQFALPSQQQVNVANSDTRKCILCICECVGNIGNAINKIQSRFSWKVFNQVFTQSLWEGFSLLLVVIPTSGCCDSLERKRGITITRNQEV